MQRLKSVGGICYATSFFFAANLFFKFNIGLSIGANLMIFITLGGLGFLLNLISYTKDKTGNPLSNLIFWLGSFLVFLGLVFQMLGFPFSISFIIIGSVILFFSIFYFRKRRTKEDNDEILDQF